MNNNNSISNLINLTAQLIGQTQAKVGVVSIPGVEAKDSATQTEEMKRVVQAWKNLPYSDLLTSTQAQLRTVQRLYSQANGELESALAPVVRLIRTKIQGQIVSSRHLDSYKHPPLIVTIYFTKLSNGKTNFKHKALF
jgi:hypothetical protein